MDAPGQQDSKPEPPKCNITQWIINSMQHLCTCLRKGENSTTLERWPDIPKELADNVWEETLKAIFKHWDKYWGRYTYMRKKYIQNAIVQTANLIDKSSTSKCISKSDFHCGMLKDPYINKIKDIWSNLSRGLPFIESESEEAPADPSPAQHSSTSCLSDWFLAFLQHLRGVLTSSKVEYFVEEHVPKPPMSPEKGIHQIFIEILATWNNIDLRPKDYGSCAEFLKYLNAMHLIFVNGVPSQKKREIEWKKLDLIDQHFKKQPQETKKKSPENLEAIFKSKICEKIVGVLNDGVDVELIDPPFEMGEFDTKQKQQLTSWFDSTKASLREIKNLKANLDRKQLQKTKKKSPEELDAIFKSKVCEKIVGVLSDSVNIEVIDPPFEMDEFDEKQKQHLTSWFDSTKALLKEKVKLRADLDRFLKDRSKIKKLEEDIAQLKNTHRGEIQNLKKALEVVLDDGCAADELKREETEKKQAMQLLYEKISAFKSERSNEIRKIKKAENKLLILKKKLNDAKQSDTFKSRLMEGLLTALENKTMVMSFDLSAELGKYDEGTKDNLQKCYKDVQKRLASKEKELQREIGDYKANISALEENRDHLLNRLSQMAGAKLKDNNPNITDLSDPNRPLKIAEQFSELYDKEWTNALENLIEAKTETESIKMLLDTVWKCYQFCNEESERITEAFLMCTDSKWRNMLEAHEHQLLSDTRKALANVHIAQIKQKFLKENIYEDIRERLAPFVEKSLELCWFMVTQSPPIYMEINFPKGTPLDKNVLKHYTVSGDTVAFVVWPVLYLHRDGPLLCKGVAQPHPKPRKVRESKQRPSTAKT